MRHSFDARRRVVTAAVLLALAVPLAACDPSGPTPPPSPSSQVSVSTGGTTSTPSPSASSSEDAKKAAYDRAVQASSTAIVEANRLVDQVGVDPHKAFPKELSDFADPEGMWYRTQAAGVQVLLKEGWRYDEPTVVVKAWPLTEPGDFSGKSLSMYVCIDGRQSQVLDKNKKVVSQGRLLHGSLVMGLSAEGNWRVLSYGEYQDAKKLVETSGCREQRG